MRTALVMWLALLAMGAGCRDHRSDMSEAPGKRKVIVDGPGTRFVPVVRVMAGRVSTKPLDSGPLIEIAKRHGLPMPPAEARLVLAHTESWGVIGSRSTSRDPGIYSPAYLLKEELGGSIRVLRGAEQVTVQARNDREPAWLPFSTEEVEPRVGGHIASFSRLSAFVCAVQTAALGNEDTAQAIWKRVCATRVWEDVNRLDEGPATLLANQRLLLGTCLFDHLRNALLEAGVNRDEIHSRMTELVKEFPELDVGWRRELRDDLSTTVHASPPQDESVEGLLLDWASRPSRMRHLGMQEAPKQDADAPARKILARGFEAVPELIALLNDRRLTAHEQPAIMRAPARIRRVGDLAHQLIRQIAGDQPSFPKLGDDTEAILAWWEKVRTQDESAVLLQGAFTREGEKITGVNEDVVRIIAAKYPARLPSVCDEFTAHALPEAQPSALAEAIAKSPLPEEVRVQSLSKFAQQGSLEHKRCVLQNLAKLDGRVCASLLLPLLAELPTDAAGPYWTCPEAGFTHVVVQIDKSEVWQAYLRAAKRSSVGLRMEMMNALNYSYLGDKNLTRRLAFLAAFLDDKSIRTISSEHGQYEGPCAGFTIRRLAVRDFAALQLASLLAMKEAPDEFWVETQWQELRRKVREELAQRQIRELREN